MAEIPGTEIGLGSNLSTDGGGAYYRYSAHSSYGSPGNLVSVPNIESVGVSALSTNMAEGDVRYQQSSFSESAEIMGATTGGYESAGITSSVYEGANFASSGFGDASSAMFTGGASEGTYASFTEDFTTIGTGGAYDVSGTYGQFTTSMTGAEGISAGAAVGTTQGLTSGFAAGSAIGASGTGVVDMAQGAILPLSAYKIQVDPNPTVIRRMLPVGYGGTASAYRQNVMIKFLRPPAPPAPGPLIIKEVRPPQPRPAPPLIIKQRPPRPRTPPPLVLRERPPKMPPTIKTEVVVKRLAAFPAPPRQVIIERYPPLPPKPRDIIIERWLQYGPLPKRRVIYQRAAQSKIYRTPKNMIIQYTAARPQIRRVFRRLGVVNANPVAYSNLYGATLMDAHSVVTAARSAGVVENITPPSLVYPVASYGSAIGYGSESLLTVGGARATGFETTTTETISESFGAESAGMTSFGATSAELESTAVTGPYDYGMSGVTGMGISTMSGVSGGMTGVGGTAGMTSEYISTGYSTGFEESGLGTMQNTTTEYQTEINENVTGEGNAMYESSYAVTETTS